MDFQLSEEHKMLQEAVREFANGELEKKAWEIDRSRKFPKDSFHKAGEMNLAGVAIPEEWGGGGMDAMAYAIMMEEISRVCATTGVILSVNNSLVCDPILKYGTDKIKKEFLIPLAKGEMLGCFCLSEPEAGTDAANQKTIAVKDGDSYVINGAKNFITSGCDADVAIMFARTGKTGTYKDISAFVVDTSLKGWKVSREEEKLGITASGSSEIALTDLRIPADCLLGEEGRGFNLALSTLDGGRIGIAGQALGIAQRALDESVKYSKVRIAFGKPISTFQAIQFKLADMATKLEASRLLTYRAAWEKDQGLRFGKMAAMAKLYASGTAKMCADEAVQIHAGYGYVKDYIVERLYRDAKITEIYEGTSEAQRMVIAKALLAE